MKFQIGAMTVGDIFDRGLKIMLSRFGVFYLINLLILSPVLLVYLIMPILADSPAALLVFVAGTLGAVILTLLLQPIGTAAILHIISEEYVDRKVGMGRALSFAMTRFASLLGTTILASLTILVGCLLIIPGIIFALNFSLISQIVVVENLSGQQAMNRSRDLVIGWRGRVFGVMFLVLVLEYAVGLVFGYLLPYQQSVQGAGGRLIPQINMTNLVLQNVGSLLVQIPFTIYEMVCITLIYFDLRVRKEGYDLELAAKQEAAPAEAL